MEQSFRENCEQIRAHRKSTRNVEQNEHIAQKRARAAEREIQRLTNYALRKTGRVQQLVLATVEEMQAELEGSQL